MKKLLFLIFLIFFGCQKEEHQLIKFVEAGDLAKLESYLTADSKELGSEVGQMAVFKAVALDKPEVLEILLKHGASPDTRDPIAKDPIIFLSVGSKNNKVSPKSLRLLAKAGADLKLRTSAMKLTLLLQAVATENIEMISAVLDLGVDVNERFSSANPSLDGGTALFMASSSGNKEVVELLLKHGAKVDIKSRDGVGPVDIAKQLNKPEIVRLLEG